MFKFVVILAFVAVAVAKPEPQLLWPSPLVQSYSSVWSPGLTSISSQSSSVIHPTPITYSSPLGLTHFIKKRSADPQLLATTYTTPYDLLPSAYPLTPAAAVISTPTVYGAELPIAAHLIKKRSADLLATPLITPTTYIGNSAWNTPLITTPYLQNPYLGAQLPLLNAHFIKKRSAEPTPEPSAKPQTFLTSPFLTPSPYVNTIATPYVANPLINSFYSTAAGIPIATTHLIKKRSAEAAPAPAADPQLVIPAISPYSGAYFPGSPLITGYPGATVIDSAPIVSVNPYVYPSFIKK